MSRMGARHARDRRRSCRRRGLPAAAVLFVVGIVGCGRTQAANLCRPRPPDVGTTSSSTDPFVHAQPIPRGTPTLAPDEGRGPPVWACVHGTPEVRGLYAIGGDIPCLAAIGDVRRGPDPDGDAEVCPPWLHANQTALFSWERTRAMREQGHDDACCYETRVYLYVSR